MPGSPHANIADAVASVRPKGRAASSASGGIAPAYAVLRDEWLLRGWSDRPSCLVNWKTGEIRPVPEEVLAVARDCDGAHAFHSMAYTPRDRAAVQALVDAGVATLLDRRAAPGDGLHPAQRYRLAPNRAIRNILVSITANCNMRCLHCYMSAPDHRYTGLTREQLLALVTQFEDANLPQIAITGGEPFISPYLEELLVALHDARIGLSDVFTNATLITEGHLDLLDRLGYRPLFKVSFDGVGTHDHMRGVPGAEKRAEAGMRLLVGRGFPVVVISSLDNVVATSIEDTLELLADVGVDQWWMAPPAEAGEWRSHDASLDLVETSSLLERTMRSWFAAGRPFDIRLWRFREYRSRAHGRAIPEDLLSFEDTTWNCEYTHHAPSVRADGVLMPCSSYTDTDLASNMPNLLDMPLCEAWDDPRVAGISTLRKGDVRRANPECMDCEFFGECGCGCRNVALVETGDLMNKDPVICRLHKDGSIRRFQELVEELQRQEDERHG